MYFTHHFAHPETLSRAHSWLRRLGFDPRQTGTHDSGVPRLVVVVEPQRLGAVSMLINAVEHADPDGFPSFWDEAKQPHSAPKASPQEAPSDPCPPRSTVIGWHPMD